MGAQRAWMAVLCLLACSGAQFRADARGGKSARHLNRPTRLTPPRRRSLALHPRLPLRPSSDPAGLAAAQCVANPNNFIGDNEPISAYLGPCRTCTADGSACAECWDGLGVTLDGACVPVSACKPACFMIRQGEPRVAGAMHIPAGWHAVYTCPCPF